MCSLLSTPLHCAPLSSYHASERFYEFWYFSYPNVHSTMSLISPVSYPIPGADAFVFLLNFTDIFLTQQHKRKLKVAACNRTHHCGWVWLHNRPTGLWDWNTREQPQRRSWRFFSYWPVLGNSRTGSKKKMLGFPKPKHSFCVYQTTSCCGGKELQNKAFWCLRFKRKRSPQQHDSKNQKTPRKSRSK